MKFLLFVLLLAAGTSFGADGDLLLSTGEGLVPVKARDARVLQGHWRWLDERYNETATIRAGSTYDDLMKHFQLDGGIHPGGDTFRFSNNLAPRLKLDVTFEGNLDLGKPDPRLKIKSISRPYLDRIIAD